MSEGTLPSQIEPGKWADREALLATSVPLRRFARLLEGALGSEGEVAVDCRFVRDARGLPHLTGNLRTTLRLSCQRCLEPADVVIDTAVDVFLLADEAYAERLSEEEDYVVFEDGQLDLPGLLEDELILALPLVARHEDCEPQVALTESPLDDAPVAKKENPFQVLASLKRPDAE